MSAAFSMVCRSPKVASKSAPETNRPWLAHTTASKVFICSEVARAMSAPPGTIHGTTPTPAGNTTTHSVMAFHSTRVKVRASSGSR